MKIKPEHFATLEKEIKKILIANPDVVTRYETGNFANWHITKDLQKRFCFDLFYAIQAPERGPLSNEIYKYANDEHLYTALKKICPTVIKRY